MKEENPQFINRERSWLEFNSRVLDEAADKGNPLLERLKFLAIFSSNLDEFFMVRVAGVSQLIESKASPGYDLAKLLVNLEDRIRTLVKRQYRYLNKEIIPELSEAGIEFVEYDSLSKEQREKLKEYYLNEIQPILTPIGVDQSHPFPLIKNGGLEILVRLQKKDNNEEVFAIIEAPSVIPRFITVERNEGRQTFITSEELIAANLDCLLSGCKIKETSFFRITRDMDFYMDEESVADMLSELQIELQKSAKRKVIRLEISSSMKNKSRKWLLNELDASPDKIFSIPGLLDLKGLFSLVSSCNSPKLLNKELQPLPSIYIEQDESIFDAITRHGSFMLHHPYESFKPVIRMLEEAADDPKVLAIKQTLYRVSGNSPVIKALARAAQNGKQVTVLIELKARFDEERNIVWARELAEAGAHVVYGIAGLKVHCKALLIIRKEENGIKRYLHLGTGNYNDSTAKLYTDIGMFSDDNLLASDVTSLFNVITGFSQPPTWNKLMVAPFTLRERLKFLINRETKVSTKENPGCIMIKVNSVIDPEIMDCLYKAASKYVKIHMIVRGICGINPFFNKDTEKNIRIVSIVDRFLEHPRIYYFRNNDSHEYYLGSADLMQRNLDRRIELLFPVEKEELKHELGTILRCGLTDKRKGRIPIGPNRYSRTTKSLKNEKSRSQIKLYNFYSKRLQKHREEQSRNQKLKIFKTAGENV